jgi:O-antigen ligase
MRPGAAPFWLWLLIVLLVPWPYGSAPDPYRFLAASGAVLVALLTTVTRPSPTRAWTVVLPLAGVPWLQVTLRTTVAPGSTLDAGLQLTAFVAAFAALRLLCAESDRRLELAVALVVVGLAQALFGVVQSVVLPSSVYGQATAWTTTPFASFVNHNHFAAVSATTAVVALGLAVHGWKQRWAPARVALSCAAAGVLVIAVLASRSRGGAVTLAIGVCAAALLVFRVRLRLALPIVAAAFAVLLALLPDARARMASLMRPDASVSYRADVAGAALRLAATRPLFGSGLGAFADAVPAVKRGHGRVRTEHAESDVLEFAAETGVTGLLAVAFALSCLFPAIRRNLAARHRRHVTGGAVAASAALVANAFLDFSWRTPAVAVVLVSCLALATAPSSEEIGNRLVPIGPALVLAALLSTCAWRAWAAFEQSRLETLAGDMDRLVALDRLVAAHPWPSELHVERARARVRLPRRATRGLDLEAAAADYRKALTWRPRWAAVWYELGWVEWARGRPREAVAALSEASRHDPGHWDLGVAEARLLHRLGERQSAAAVLRNLAERNPDVPRDQLTALERELPE